MKGRLAVALTCIASMWQPIAAGGEPDAAAAALKWSRLPPLPPAPGQAKQVGLAGPFAGVHNRGLIVAGGANFPEAVPWRGGKKRWWADVYVLVKTAEGEHRWITDGQFKLPRPLAYGAAVPTDEGLLCIGGCDADRCYRETFLLKWDPEAGKIDVEPYPPLPRPLAFMAAAKVGEVVYVAGGQETMAAARATRTFFALDLSKRTDGRPGPWRELPPWRGHPRVVPVAAAQSDGATDCFYLFSGRKTRPGIYAIPLTDAHRYNPKTKQWTELRPIAPPGQPARCVMAATAVASGAHHVLVFGGADGVLFRRLEKLAYQVMDATDEADRKRFEQERQEVLDTHPGFSRDVLAYCTVTDAWAEAGKLPTGSHVTTVAVNYDGAAVIPTGEIRPGIRSPDLWRGDPVPAAPFGWINYTVLAVYLAALVCMGVHFSRRERTTEDFFKASGRVPWWAAGMSIFGTQLSAITFMSIPAKTFATDWRRLTGNVCILIVAPLIVAVMLPFYRRLNVTTAYEYLEKRFNVVARLLGSVMFILFQFGRIGIVLFLPSIALSVVTGIDVRLCILVMGVLSVVYTVLGGIEAVIWTDVLQVVVLLGGALLSVVLILLSLDSPVIDLLDVGAKAGKFRTFDFRFDFTDMTFWVVLIGGLAANFISYGTDQTVIQRYLTTRDERSAGRSIWTNALLSMPASLLFFFLGTALFALFRARPELANPTLANADAVFPWYIVTQLPAGVAGLLIAGVFAAAMSSLDSSMNSVATAVVTDFYRRFRPDASDGSALRTARWATVAVGAAGTLFALMMAGWQIKSLWDQFSKVLGLFSGGLGGLFLLGVFTRRAHGVGAVIGLLLSGAVTLVVQQFTPVSFLLYGACGLGASFGGGYLASLLIPIKARPTEGLTVYTLAKPPNRAEPT